MGFFTWLFGFLFGGFFGVVLMAIIQACDSKTEDEVYYDMPVENNEEESEPFTYDCLNDPDPDDTDIPKLY